ncbi:MAG: tyrosine-type recombinase/integrase [Planctomycetota bacterium]|jgi:integrase
MMAGKRKRPTLRFDDRYWITTIYKPNGVRGTVSFGSPNERPERDIKIAFEIWIDLFLKHPHKTLSYGDPYKAIEQFINPTTVSTVGHLLNKYQSTYEKQARPVRNGLEHPNLRFIKRVRRFLEVYYDWAVDSFGPDELAVIKMKLREYRYCKGKVKKQYTRRGINDTLKWIKKIFKWGVGRRIVSQETLISLDEVKPYRMGERGTFDKIKRPRITEEEFQKVINCVNSVVGDILTLLWHTGMRPYEICEMRPFDILRDDPECWIYIPGRDKTPVGMHKTTGYGKIKVIPLAGDCIDILKRRIDVFDSKQFVFSPKDSMNEFLANKRINRKTPLSCGNIPGSNRKQNPKWKVGDAYNNSSLELACKRACVKAGIEPFVPYDLRRTAATKTRASLGKEAAKTLLGHAEQSTTDIYLLDEVQEAMKVAKALAKYNKSA